MTSRIIFTALIILCASPNLSLAQGTLTARPTYNFFLNGVDAEGLIHSSDSILSVFNSDYQQYYVVGIEMSCGERKLSINGDQFSKQMRDYIRSCPKRQRLMTVIMLKAPNSGRIKVPTVFMKA